MQLVHLAEIDLPALRRSLQGHKITRVRYIPNQEGVWPFGHSVTVIHEVDVAIWVSLENGTTLAIAWEMDGLLEGISVSIVTTSSLGTAHSVDVSELADWTRIIGATVSEVGTAWQVANEGCPPTLWAVRISLSDGEQVAFALGEIRDGTLSYQPDGLVALFGVDTVDSYRIPASQESAAGTTIQGELAVNTQADDRGSNSTRRAQ